MFEEMWFKVVGWLLFEVCLPAIVPMFFGVLVFTIGLRDFCRRINLKAILESVADAAVRRIKS